MKAARGVFVTLVCVVLGGCTGRHGDTTEQRTERPTVTMARVAADAPPKDLETTDAVTVAVRFVCSGQRLLDTSPVQLADVIHSLWTAAAADGAVTATVNQLSQLRDRLSPGSGPTRWTQSAMATRVESASADQVTVSVWWVGVLSREGALAPQAMWTTSAITLVPEGGSWRVAAESSELGPTPDASSDSIPISISEFEHRLDGYDDWDSAR